MMLQDKLTLGTEIVKAKFIESSYVIACAGNTIGIFDIRKPNILVSKVSLSNTSNSDEINDMDFTGSANKY